MRISDLSLDAAVDDAFIHPVFFVELMFDDGTLYLHTDLGQIGPYTGTGDLGSMDAIEETEEIAPVSVKLRLSGIDDAVLNEALEENYFERPGRILMSARDIVTGELIAPPEEIFYGKMDSLRVLYGPDQTAVEVVLESEMADFDRAAMKYYSDSQLQRDYSGDLGLRYLAQVMDSRVMWGKNNATLVYSKGGRTGTQNASQIIGNALDAFF